MKIAKTATKGVSQEGWLFCIYKSDKGFTEWIPKRSNGLPKFITVKDVPIDSKGNTAEKRVPDYSEFYNIKRLSEELSKVQDEYLTGRANEKR